MPQLTNYTKSIRHSNAVAAGTSTITPSGSIDLANAEGVKFIVEFGTITSTAVTSIKLQQSSASGSGFADVAGSSITVADTASNKIFELDHFKPTKRYAKIIVSRGTANAVLEGITAIVFHTRNQPNTADSTVGGTKLLSGAIEGTA